MKEEAKYHQKHTYVKLKGKWNGWGEQMIPESNFQYTL